MPPKKRKARLSKPEPPPIDPSVTQYKMFASSKSSKGIKVKGRMEPKREGRRPSTASQSSARITNSQFSVVISDSESDDEAEEDNGDGDAGPSASTSQAKKPVVQDDDDEGQDRDGDKDGYEEMAESEASSSRQSRSGNRAKCSRGRGASKMVAGSNGHNVKVSSFKPLPKSAPQSIKAKEMPQKHTSGSNGSIKAEAEAEEEVPHAIVAENGNKKATDTLRGISDSEGEEEFHEPTPFRKSVSVSRESSDLGGKVVAEPPNKKRKASDDEVDEGDGDDDEDDDHIDSVLGQAIPVPLKEASTESEEQRSDDDYITREEHESAIRTLREEMKQEIEHLRSAMRVETKRLIRTEVKDEVALMQEK